VRYCVDCIARVLYGVCMSTPSKTLTAIASKLRFARNRRDQAQAACDWLTFGRYDRACKALLAAWYRADWQVQS